jgi:hypothetical protein
MKGGRSHPLWQKKRKEKKISNMKKKNKNKKGKKMCLKREGPHLPWIFF